MSGEGRSREELEFQAKAHAAARRHMGLPPLPSEEPAKPFDWSPLLCRSEPRPGDQGDPSMHRKISPVTGNHYCATKLEHHEADDGLGCQCYACCMWAEGEQMLEDGR